MSSEHLRWAFLTVVFAVATTLVLVGGLLLSRYPRVSTARVREQLPAILPDNSKDQLAEVALEKDLLQLEMDSEIKIWTIVVQAAGGLVAAGGAYLVWRNLRATLARLEMDREGQITNRFTQAIGQLGAELQNGKPNIEARIGGIYALERIANDSPRDHWIVMEVFAAYIRQHSAWKELRPTRAAARQGSSLERRDRPRNRSTPRMDIQVIMQILRRRRMPEDVPWPHRLDLRYVDLRGAELSGAHLELVDLEGAHLEGARLREANLNGARLVGAHLERADLHYAQLEFANLAHATLSDADLARTRLQAADFASACLRRAVLARAQLDGTNFQGACLDGADLTDASVQGAKNLEQLRQAPHGGVALQSHNAL